MNHPLEFFNEETAKKYATNIGVQSFQLTALARCLQVAKIKTPSFLLELGSGTGTSMCGAEALGHHVIGLDMSLPMIRRSRNLTSSSKPSSSISSSLKESIPQSKSTLCVERILDSITFNTHTPNSSFQEAASSHQPLSIKQEFSNFLKKTSDEVLGDFAVSLPFHSEAFDGAFGVASVEWLFQITSKSQSFSSRLSSFLGELHRVLVWGAPAVFLLTPPKKEMNRMVEILTKAATKTGFLVEIQIDFPNSSKKKTVFLRLGKGSMESERAEGERWTDKVERDARERRAVKGMGRRERKKYLREKEREKVRGKEEGGETVRKVKLGQGKKKKKARRKRVEECEWNYNGE